jgi:oxygen-dependent protoporphyrinogen oxidase
MGGVRVVVVGAGVSGLAAAHRLAGLGAEVVVVDGARRAGGKLRTVELAGGPAEAGADAFLTADPQGGPSAAVMLAGDLGLDLVHPATNRAALVVGGRLAPMPPGTLMGVPSDLRALDGLAAAADRDHDGGRPLLRPDEDAAVGVLVRARLGDEVADRLVDPLLGGVYAGRADNLSLATTVPPLAAACRQEATLTGAVRAALAARPPGGGPVFSTVAGGLSRLVDALVTRLTSYGVEMRLGSPARSLGRNGTRWRIGLGRSTVDADAVVLAVPARPAARLLSDVDGAIATTVGALDYASVALVGLVLPALDLPELSGLLVPATEGFAVKAVTFVDRKWAHAARPGASVIRASIGRYGEVGPLTLDDASLAALAHDELGRLLGGEPLPAPLAVAVHRWGGALPQYAPGHLDRVAAVRAALPAGLALAGAAYDRVGIPACVESGWAAADRAVGELSA